MKSDHLSNKCVNKSDKDVVKKPVNKMKTRLQDKKGDKKKEVNTNPSPKNTRSKGKQRRKKVSNLLHDIAW